VLDNIMVGRHHLLKNNFITGSLYWLTGARREELEHRRKVEEIIDFLDLQPVRKATAGTLPYGLRKRVELARAMALEPQLILLDEPMAGMNFEEKEDMARYIVDLNEEFGMTVMMIEVLPAPLGPMIENSSPSFTPKLTSVSARTPPKRNDTPRTSKACSTHSLRLPRFYALSGWR